VSCALLVADQDVADLGVVERVVRRQDRSAGNAEGDLDAERLERPHERVGTGGRGRRDRGYRLAPGRGRGGGGRVGSLGECLGRGWSRHGSALHVMSAWISHRCVQSVMTLPSVRSVGPVLEQQKRPSCCESTGPGALTPRGRGWSALT
jgi:hypothetical protein